MSQSRWPSMSGTACCLLLLLLAHCPIGTMAHGASRHRESGGFSSSEDGHGVILAGVDVKFMKTKVHAHPDWDKVPGWSEKVHSSKHWPCQDVTSAIVNTAQNSYQLRPDENTCVDFTIYGQAKATNTGMGHERGGGLDNDNQTRTDSGGEHVGKAGPQLKAGVTTMTKTYMTRRRRLYRGHGRIQHQHRRHQLPSPDTGDGHHSNNREGHTDHYHGRHHHRHHHHHDQGVVDPSLHASHQAHEQEEEEDSLHVSHGDDPGDYESTPPTLDTSEAVEESNETDTEIQSLVKTRRRRQAQAAAPAPCLTTTIDLLLLSALTSENRTRVHLGTDFRRSSLSYGNSEATKLMVIATDFYEIEHDEEIISYALSSAQHGLPCNGELYMCVDRTRGMKLHLNLALFYPTMSVQLAKANKALIFVYNSLTVLGHNATLDVLLFSSRLATLQMPALFRVGSNLGLNNEAEALVPAGKYIIKLVRHETITNHCGFQRVTSILPEMTLDLEKGTHYFISLLGIITFDKFSARKNKNDDFRFPQLPYVPAVNVHPAKALKVKTVPKAALIIINAHRSLSQVRFKLTAPHFKVYVNYSDVYIARHVRIEEGDCYGLKVESSKIIDLVYNAIADNAADCMVVPDHDANGALDVFFHCFNRNEILPGPDYAEILVYHALGGLGNRTNIDILIKTKGSDSSTPPAVYSVAFNLTLGYGTPSIILAGHYDLKVTEHGKVKTVAEFDSTPSLIDDTELYLKPEQAYYATIQGFRGDQKDYPAIFNVFPKDVKPSVELAEVSPTHGSLVRSYAPAFHPDTIHFLVISASLTLTIWMAQTV